jgi:hypothetical protein
MLHPILMWHIWHICAYKLAILIRHIHASLHKLVAATHKYFLVNIHINNQSTLYKVNGVVDRKWWASSTRLTTHVRRLAFEW